MIFFMNQGILTRSKVHLLLSKEHSCGSRRPGEEKHKFVHRCITDDNLSIFNSVTVKKKENDIPGLDDSIVPQQLRSKRGNDVHQYVIRKPLNNEGKKPTQDSASCYSTCPAM